MMRQWIVETAVTGFFGLAVLAFSGPAAAEQGAAAPAAQAQHEHKDGRAPDAAASQPATTQQPGQMMAMMETMRASEARLRELAAKMQAARGEAKIDAMAELLAAMVADRSLMHVQMLQHHETMMKQMMPMMSGMKEKMHQMQKQGEGPTQQPPGSDR